MVSGQLFPVRLSTKICAWTPGADESGYCAPDSTHQFAFGVVGGDTSFAEIVAADGFLDEDRLIGGVHHVSGDQVITFSLAPGRYRLYEFTIVRHPSDRPKFARLGGWQFKAEINGIEVAAIGNENAVPFEVRSNAPALSIVGINRSFSVQVEKLADGHLKPGTMFFGTSSYLGIIPDSQSGDAAAVLRMGITDSRGTVRLDGFSSGGNAFIHEVIPKSDYDAGVHATRMEVFRLDGTRWFATDVPAVHCVTQDDLDALGCDPRLNATARDLIRRNLRPGDYLCGAQDYLYGHQGMLQVVSHHH